MKTKPVENKIENFIGLLGKTKDGMLGFVPNLRRDVIHLQVGASVNIGIPPMLIIIQSNGAGADAALYFAQLNTAHLLAGPSNLYGVNIQSSMAGVTITNERGNIAYLRYTALTLL